MKKYLTFIILLILYLSADNAHGYYYNNKDYEIYNPYKKYELDYAEYLYNIWELDDKLYIYKLVSVNISLIKKWLKPLY